MNFIKLTDEKLCIESVNDLVADESCGAISLFVGTTRDNFEDKKVKNLQYEAYEPMAVKVMKKICNDLREKFADIKKIAIHHRLGVVPVKEASVIIAISSPHRQTSLDAVNIAIDELKKSVPIWKKEQYQDEESSWKENKECPVEPKRLKLLKLNFNACPIDSVTNSSSLVQISADENEIKRRIGCFVEKKREEIDLNNILDFTNRTNVNIPIDDLVDDDETSCARVNSIVLKKKDSKGHLKVHRVKNEYGPQTKPDYLNALDKLMKNELNESPTKIKRESIDLNNEDESNATKDKVPFGIRERLENAENFLNIKTPNMKNIYQRIKEVENKILFLESISPEYFHFLRDSPINQQIVKKKTYSVEDIDTLINTVKTV